MKKQKRTETVKEKLMTTEEVSAKFAALEEIKIYKAKKMEYVEQFLPSGSRLYDKGIATLEDGSKVEIAWSGDTSLNLDKVKAIHALDIEREFVQFQDYNMYHPVLKESEK